MAGPRSEAEQLVGPRRSQPLELDRQLRAVEVVARWRRWKLVRGEARRRRPRTPAGPVHPWSGASRRCPTSSAESPFRVPACSGRDCESAARRDRRCSVSPVCVSTRSACPARCSATSGRSRAVRMYDVGMQLVGARQRPRPRHRHGVPPAGAALGREQVVEPVALVEVRRFGEPERRALEDRPGASPIRRRSAAEYSCSTMPANRLRPGRWSHSMLSRYLRPSSSWNSEGSKPLLFKIDRIGPLAVDLPAGHEVVVEVAQRRAGGAADGRAAVALDVGVDQIEQAVVVGQAGRPDAARVRDRRACSTGSREPAGASAAASARGRASDGSARRGTTRRSTWRCSSRRRRARWTGRG